MSDEDSLEVRQTREFEALQGIYLDELKDLRQKPAWKNQFRPLNLSISLTPQRGSSGNGEVHVQVDLHIICSPAYPNETPTILLENYKGIAQTHLNQLQKELQQMAQKNKGEEVIYKLCEYVREFLHPHNKPTMKSFYDEMLQTQRAKQQEEELQKQLEENRKRESYRKQVQEREQMLDEEARGRRRLRGTSESEFEEEATFRRTSFVARRLNGNLETGDELSCDHKGVVSLDFTGRQVQRGQCIRHVDSSNVIYSGMDVNTGEILEVAQWTLKPKSHEVAQFVKNVASIEQELNYYVSKLRHPNLVNYLGMRHDSLDDQIVVDVLKELVLGSNCYSLYTGRNRTIDIDFLKHLAQGVLTAIEYIHRNNVVHKNLRDSCVTINDKGVVKLSNYGIPRRLSDLVNATHGNYSKKTDIFDFGKMLLGLLGHGDVADVPAHLPSDLCDFLSNCLNKEEKERYTASQLLNHPFFQKAINEPFSAFDHQFEAPIEPVALPGRLFNSANNGHYRINQEFEILDCIGSGAFGEVLKVKNKLDERYYAIKKIKLDPSSNKKKIVREVTLLSRLNHENIVRYFYSWIETTTIKGEVEEDSSSSVITNTTQTSPPNKAAKAARKDELTLDDDIEELAPPLASVEVSVTFDSTSQPPYDESSEDDSSDDDDHPLVAPDNRFAEDSESDGIIFERGSGEDSASSKSSQQVASPQMDIVPTETPKEMVREENYLYIQMEFCERSTLRTAIDANLYENEDRVWRLFREIVEGLAHIHMQGIIHRDLKPVNIFLDSCDHVKIGDFGLATSIALRTKQGEAIGISKSHIESLKEDLTEESKTGYIGTVLYVAPEINAATKANYNEKVDIYSLGIILFEMCYKPLETKMERIAILNKLRTKDILFPDDFLKNNARGHTLVRLLLNHDISKRPSSQELLQSKYLPPPVVEEQRLQDLVRHTLNNPQLKSYRYLISSCFKQSLSPAQDITYDRDPTRQIAAKLLNLYEFVRGTCVKIFKQHGGQDLATPLLMPKSKYYEKVDSCVNLMAHFGNIVSLPHDLRVPFARYVALNHISYLRRYSVEKVFKEKKMFGFLPREFYECAFDIVTAHPGSQLADAEILYIVYEIIKELPGARSKPFLIKLNHTSLFEALLLHFGLKDKKQELLNLMQEIKKGSLSKIQLQNFLIQRNLSESMIDSLLSLLYSDIELGKVPGYFQIITRKRSSEAADLAKTAIQELKMIAQNAESYGVKFDFAISPGLVYNIHQYSGMICQFVCELKKKRKVNNKEVIAAGGRYDGMIHYYRNVMEHINMLGKDVQQSAVGISISLDNLVQAVIKQDVEEVPKLNSLDAVVCSVGQKLNINSKEKIKILKSLQETGSSFSLIEAPTINAVQDQLSELSLSRAIIFRDDNQSTLSVWYWDKDSRGDTSSHFHEKVFPISSFIENMHKILKIRTESPTESAQPSTTLVRSESKTNYSEKSDSDVDILLITSEKLSSNSRKRFENQVRSQLDRIFKKLSGMTTVIAVNLDSKFVSELSSFVDFDCEDRFSKSVQDLISKYQKQKQCVDEICDEIWKIRMKNTSPTVILYSLPDKIHKIIM